MRAISSALLVLVLGAPASAAELRPFCAARPAKATPACILDQGHWQVETGLGDASFSRGGGEREDLYLLGGTEVRYGLSRRVELEATWTRWVVDRRSGEARRKGAGDLEISARGAFTDPDADGLAVSWQAFADAPTGVGGVGAGGWGGGLRLPVSGNISETLNFGLTPEVDVLPDEDGRGTHLALAAAGGINRTLGGATLGAELWGQWEDDPSGGAWQASADVSAAWMVGENQQLDVGANVGLTHATPDLQVYVGVARRF